MIRDRLATAAHRSEEETSIVSIPFYCAPKIKDENDSMKIRFILNEVCVDVRRMMFSAKLIRSQIKTIWYKKLYVLIIPMKSFKIS